MKIAPRARVESASAAHVLGRMSGHCSAEPLERRALLSLTPAGAEFRGNSYTNSDQSSPSVAADADGDFVMVWSSTGQDSSGEGVYGRRFSAAGFPQGDEFRVNTTTLNNQTQPDVAVDADGDFVVVWTSGEIFGQRFNALGAKQGLEFKVSDSVSGALNPDVAADASGGFVVAWQALDSDNEGITARRYDATGAPLAIQFRVNEHTTGSQVAPSVAVDASGDFVVAWSGPGPGDADGVYARQFNSAGVTQGGQFRVNVYTTSFQGQPSVAMDASGDFVVAYNSMAQDGSVYGVYARRYNSGGGAQGAEFRVNTYTTSTQSTAAAAMDHDGDFLIAWESNAQDGSAGGTYAQHFNALGVKQGPERRANTFTTGVQWLPAVAMTSTGDAVVAWQSQGQDGSFAGIYAQRYDESAPDTAPPMVTGAFVNGLRTMPYSVQEPALQQVVVAVSELVTGADNIANWTLTRNGADVTSEISGITFGLNVIANRYEAVLNLSTSYTDGNFQLTARDGIRDAANNPLDGNVDGTPGGMFALPFSLPSFAPAGGEFRVNTFTTHGQGSPSIAMAPGGSFLVAWARIMEGSQREINAQRYDAAGVPQGGEFFVNSLGVTPEVPTTDVAINAAGNFVIAYGFGGQFIVLQRYDAAGVQQGSPIVIFPPHARNAEPRVAMAADGGFVVVWSIGDQNNEDVVARRYNEAGVPVSGFFTVNSFTTNYQRRPDIAMEPDGDFIVTWSGYGPLTPPSDGSDVFAQRYNGQGVPQGGNFQINQTQSSTQSFPGVALDSGGNFVVAWQSAIANFQFDVFARRYTASGQPREDEFRVNELTADDQRNATVAMDRDGDFVVSWWTGPGTVQDELDIHARRFGAASGALGPEWRVNTYTPGRQSGVQAAMDADGDFVIAWQDFHGQDGSVDGVFAQRYEAHATPAVAALAGSPNPVAPGAPLTLTATGVADDDAVTSVSFYRETNNVAGPQVGFQGDTLVGTDTTPGPGGQWSASVSTVGLSAGSYTYWAQATDNDGLTGRPASTTNRVVSSVAAPLPEPKRPPPILHRLPPGPFSDINIGFEEEDRPGGGIDDLLI